MKRLIIVFIALATINVAANAQFFVEGSIGFENFDVKTDRTGNSLTETSRTSSTIIFSPQAGYWLNDNIALGARLTLYQSEAKDKEVRDLQPIGDTNVKHSRWRLSAFGRYKLWGTEKFSLLLDGSLFYEENSERYTNKRVDSFQKSSTYDSKIGIGLFPAVTYDINERLRDEK